VLFGLYHFAHSPPFNAWPMVGLLSAVGLATSAFFFVSREAIGTLLFHNLVATYGVLNALAQANALQPLQTLQPHLVAMALLSVAAFAGGYAWLSRRGTASA
jgi:hypothetical protein